MSRTHTQQMMTARQQKAIQLQNDWRSWAYNEGTAFVEKARIAWKIRNLGLYAELGYRTFDEWAVAPEQNETVTGANLGAQVMDVFVVFWRIRRPALYGVGFKKLMLITPIAQKMSEALDKSLEHHWEYESWKAAWQAEWKAARREVLELLESARSLTWSALHDKCKDARDGWNTIYSERVPVGLLRRAESVEVLLDMLGLSDLQNEERVKISIRGKGQVQGERKAATQ